MDNQNNSFSLSEAIVNWAKIESQQTVENNNHQNDDNIFNNEVKKEITRKALKYSSRILIGASIYYAIIAVAALVAVYLDYAINYHINTHIIIALLTSTSANIWGSVVIVMKYIFKHN